MTTLTAPPQTAKAPAPQGNLKRHTLIVTSLGYFIVILDTTAKNVALPRIGADLHAGIGSLQWVVNSYLLVFAACLLTAGALADRLGARRIFATGMAVFGVASLASAVAQGPTQLAALQAVAGLGAALVTPASLALLVTVFTDPKERGKALGIWATIAGVGTATGPLIGGGLVDLAGWRSVFFINVPIAIAGIVMVRAWLAEAPRHPARALDLGGQIAGIATLAALSYAIVTAGDHGWGSTNAVAGFAVAVVAALAFVAIESHSEAPMLPLEILKGRRFSSSVLAGLTINFGTFGQLFLLTLYFQNQRGFSPFGTGIAQLPMSVVCMIVPTYAGKAVAKIGPRVPLALGLVIAAAGALGLTVLSPGSAYGEAVPGLFLIGVGCSIAIPAVAAAAMSGVAPTHVGIASGVLNTSRQTGAVLGVAVLGAVVNGGNFSHLLPYAFGITAAVQAAGGLLAYTGLRPARVMDVAVSSASGPAARIEVSAASEARNGVSAGSRA